MNKDARTWNLIAGTLAILVGVALALQAQIAGPALPRLLAGLALGFLGVWLMAQANREPPS